MREEMKERELGMIKVKALLLLIILKNDLIMIIKNAEWYIYRINKVKYDDVGMINY